MQVAASPLLRKGSSQRYLCRPSLRAGTPPPAAPKVLFPVSSPATLAFPERTRVGAWHRSTTATSDGERFWSCSHSFTLRPTGLFASQVAPTLTLACRAAETFTAAHITVGYLPRAAAMLTTQYRAIDGKGTCTPQIRQTCWLLRTWRRSTARPQTPAQVVRRGRVARPKADFRRSSAGSRRAAPSRSAVRRRDFQRQ